MPPRNLVAELAEAPERSALVFDVDGTLAPIVRRPELADVPEETRTELRRLVARYGLVACLSGRPASQASELVAVDGIRYVGNHGIELHPDAADAAAAVARFRDTVAGLWPVEDKVYDLAFHYREAEDQEAAEAVMRTIADRAREAGLDARFGRKILEVRPRLGADKGTAVRALVADAAATRGFYAGDDTTDLDAFRGLREAGLETAACVAISSPEVSPSLLEAADLVLDSPEELRELMRRL